MNTETNMTGKANMRTKIIKRYQNRKLYDTQQSCYVTLDDHRQDDSQQRRSDGY